jgi:hypothetical protein
MRLTVSNANFYQTNFQYRHRHITAIINYHKHCKYTLKFYFLVYLLIKSLFHKACNAVSEQPKRSPKLALLPFPEIADSRRYRINRLHTVV